MTPPLSELRALLAAAGAEPRWRLAEPFHFTVTTDGYIVANFRRGEDAALDCAAVNALPDLLDRLERAEKGEALLRDAVALLRRAGPYLGRGTECHGDKCREDDCESCFGDFAATSGHAEDACRQIDTFLSEGSKP